MPLDQALKFLEGEAAKILPKGYTIDYTGESRQLRVEGDKFLPAFLLAVTLIFLVLAAQFNSFRDPFIILLGSVPLALFGAMIFMFEKSPNPNLKFFTNALDNQLQHLLAGRARHARRPYRQERDSHRRVREQTTTGRPQQDRCSCGSRARPAAADLDDHHRDGCGSHATRLRDRRRARKREIPSVWYWWAG